ncbi:MAG: leucyl aminopeptidase [Candidatus Dormibacteria bacterium]
MQAQPALGDLAQLDVDAIVVPYLQGPSWGPGAQALDQFLDGLLSAMRDQQEITGKFPERTVVATAGRLTAPRVVLLGLGRADYLDGYRLRNALQFAARQTRSFCPRLAVLVEAPLTGALGAADPSLAEPAALARAVAEGVTLGNYHLGQLKAADAPGEVETLVVAGLGSDAEIQSALSDGVLLGEATNRTRTLQWQPSNQLTPTQLAEQAAAVAAEAGLEFEVLERADAERLGMGALLAVARGSHEPLKLISMRYRPQGRSGNGTVLGLVGKGITFDTGGISLKANPGMSAMKSDMSGAAAVILAMSLIARRRAPLEVVGVAPLTENMPGGGAIKPGDVVTAMNGRTIEINNTDAEGRLILADGLCYAAHLGANHLVDVATLTGGVIIALGHSISAAMGTSPDLVAKVLQAGQLAGERIWELPLLPEHDVALTCDIADIRNTSGTSSSSSINGGIFLREFTGSLPWVHLDIAGSSYHEEALLAPLVPKGPSGVMTRTLAHLPFLLA